MNVSYEGIGYLAVTMPADGCVVGDICCLSLAGYAGSCATGSSFIGVVEAVEGDYAAVQVEGVVKVYYSGNAPLLGYRKLSANGVGGVKADDQGREYLVLDVDRAESMVTFKL